MDMINLGRQLTDSFGPLVIKPSPVRGMVSETIWGQGNQSLTSISPFAGHWVSRSIVKFQEGPVESYAP